MRIGPIEPITAGNNTNTPDDPTDASRPCNPQSFATPSYNGPTGCLFTLADPNCFNPNRVSLGLAYATTEECRNMRPADDPQRVPGDPNNPPQDPAEFCRSGAPSFPDPAVEARPNDGVKARAGTANLFLTAGGQPSNTSPPTANFIHLSGINAFANVRCDPQGQAQFDARSQVTWVDLGNQAALDVIPGLLPGVRPTAEYNTYEEGGPFRFNATYINDREPGGVIGDPFFEGRPQPTDTRAEVPGPGGTMQPNPNLGRPRFDINPDGSAAPPVYKVTQRAFELTSSGGNAASTIVAGEATVDIASNARELAANQGACRPDARPNGTITVTKVAPAGDTTEFGFTDNTGRFTLRGGQSRTTQPQPAGTYTITEDDRPEYAESVTCVDPSGDSTTSGRTATVVLAANENVTCTFTNTRDGNDNIIIRKDTVPDGPQDFSFTGSGGIGNFQLDDDGDPTLPNQRGFRVAAPGEYTVTEAAQRGWRVTVRCTDPSGNSRGDGRTARINVAANEVVTCTFTNRKAKKPPKCDRDGDGKEDHDRDRDGRDDRDKNDDGRDDRNGRHLRRMDRNGDGRDDECERDRKERKRCNTRFKKADNDGRRDDDDRGRRKGDRRDDDKGRNKGDRNDDDKKGCRSKRSKKSKR